MVPRKKRKIEAKSTAFGDILADLDFEISLRERVVDTAELRIAWALLLQESLDEGGSAAKTSSGSSVFDALSVIEEPLGALFSQCPLLPPRLQGTKAIRLPPKQKNPMAKNGKSNFLFIRSPDLDPRYDTNHIQTYLLRCPACSRQSFTSLQGLLNHARIGHNLEWGTHDECVRACAIVDPDLDLEAGTEVGLGPSGILPGLRSLFQLAVGAHRSQGPEASMSGKATGDILHHDFDIGSHLTRTLGIHRDTAALAPFLGKQALRRGIRIWDTGDEILDIATARPDSDIFSIHLSKKKWRMPFTHRSSVASSANSMDVEPTDSRRLLVPNVEFCTRNEGLTPMDLDPEGIELPSGTNPSTSGSRFHFTVRVVLTDRSFWVPLDQRQEIMGDTHKWMLSIESPSYSRNITTVLQHFRVTSLSDSSANPKALIKSEPPFIVVGTADQPFLARVELVFSGISYSSGWTDNQTIILEHWVELDLLKSPNGTIGDEQVIDIELDKRTILMPARSSNVAIVSKSLWNLGFGQPVSNYNRTVIQGQSLSGDNDQYNGYKRILSGLVRKFPMTQKDGGKARPLNLNLPYRLVSSPTQLTSLVHGRRKAIEWGRARALQKAYTREINSLKYVQNAVIPLTVGDVFAWLTEEGHFSKSPGCILKKIENFTQAVKVEKPVEIWCSVCGQDVEAHLSISTIKGDTVDPGIKMKDIIRQPKNTKSNLDETSNSNSLPIPCNIVPINLQLSRSIITSMGSPTNINQSSSQHGNAKPQIPHPILRPRFLKHYQPAIIVSTIPPVMTLAVRKLIMSLNLPAFSLEPFDHFPYDEYSLNSAGTHRSSVECHLAPHAMVALATKHFIRFLIEGALEVSSGEKGTAVGFVAPTTRRNRKGGHEKSENIRLLTPAHLLSSLMTRGQGQSREHCELNVAIVGCLAKIGVPKEHSVLENTEGLAFQVEG
ncbi:hypothetical protein BDZ94DRAFT_1274872 [Collybia nuda]|uniref:YEATS domain-containing protein n=1 Tax=Collybia nuda TaxID=64659 RepID=A0A9P6C8Y6_9AGAR|nr:hypothetical protein BDZ94DRAFT_1274872 [Collybia nuda]